MRDEQPPFSAACPMAPGLSFRGLIPATVLPMARGGKIDEGAMRRYMRWISRQGVVGVAVNVDTGEAAHLSPNEKCRVLEIAREELPSEIMLIAGISGPYTSLAVSQGRDYKAIGADALLVFPISAYLSTPLNPQIPYNYHAAVASVGLPLIVFRLQASLGGVDYSDEVMSKLLEIDSVVAVKEASFDARRFAQTVDVVQSAPQSVAILTGNDNFIFESFLLGAEGALIGFGAIMTSEQVEMIKLALQGETSHARTNARAIQRLADAIFADPIGDYRARIKEVLVMQGVLEEAYVREPLIGISAGERNSLRELLVKLGQLEG